MTTNKSKEGRLIEELKEAREETWGVLRGIMDATGIEHVDEIGPGYDPRAEIASFLRAWKEDGRENTIKSLNCEVCGAPKDKYGYCPLSFDHKEGTGVRTD